MPRAEQLPRSLDLRRSAPVPSRLREQTVMGRQKNGSVRDRILNRWCRRDGWGGVRLAAPESGVALSYGILHKSVWGAEVPSLYLTVNQLKSRIGIG